jgi:hypothetical protein
LTTQNSSRKKERKGAASYSKNIGSEEFSTNNLGEDEENVNSQKTGAEEETETQRKTVARTFRIYEELTTSFEKQVADMNTTQTNLMNEILKQYLSWSRFIVNHDSPFLTFDSGTFLSLIEGIDDAKLEKLVKEISNEAAIDFIKFRWRKVNFQNIVRYLHLLSSYANIGNINVVRDNGIGINNNNGNGGSYENNNGEYDEYEIAVRHHLGKRWSTLLAMYISNLFISSISDTKADYEVSNKSCFVYLKMGIKNGAGKTSSG